MTFRRARFAVLLLLAIGSTVLLAQTPSSVRVTYLYDNTLNAQGVKADWGFACLVEAHGRTILFDTGAKPEVLRGNLSALKVDPQRVEALVFSHDHGDHTGGLAGFTPKPGIPGYYAQGFAPRVGQALAAAGFKATPVSRPTLVFPGFTVTEGMVPEGSPAAPATGSIVEDALLVDTPRGLLVIVGCAHPGIVPMLRRIKETSGRSIYMVLGGLHLLNTPPDGVRQIVAAFKTLGVVYAGPTHCTGDEAMGLFKQAYGDHFVQGGVGTVVAAF